jgi:lipopolysaccharide heptosyltransferase II
MMLPEDAKNILVINLGGIGDCLLSTPALRGLRAFYPKAHISVLTMSRSREILEGAGFADEIISIQSFKDPRGVWAVLMALRKKKIDIGINMRTIASFWGAAKMALLFFLIGPRLKAGRNTDGRGFFLDIKLPESLAGMKHDIDYNIELVKLLGAPELSRRPELTFQKEDRDYADRILRYHAISDDNVIVGMSPGAPYAAKRWPLENFVKTASLFAGYGYKVIIIGSKDEKKSERAFKEMDNPNIISLIGNTTIKQTAALINRCSVFIANDTGPMHIAAVLGAPVVAIFGPGYLARFDPRNISDKAVVLYKKADCAPCTRETCGSLKCLKSISYDEVVKAALELLKKYKKKD